MNNNGYPDDEELEKIENWPRKDFIGLMEYVKELWCDSTRFFQKRSGNKITYFLYTRGWSGNEDIIGALMKNTMFWMNCWVQSRRGGHYIFEV